MKRETSLNRIAFAAACAQVGLCLSDSQFGHFEQFEENLYLANEEMNLTRIPRDEAWVKHFLDSLLFQDLLPENASLLDVGTGPGFPSWPLAQARPDLKVVALDSSGKMLGFLRKNPLPNLRIVQARAEEWMPPAEFEVVTGRAVAPLAVQLEISAPLAAKGGMVIPMRTPAEEPLLSQDVSALGLELESVHRRELGSSGVSRLFPIYRKFGRSRPRRSWAEMKRKPLF